MPVQGMKAPWFLAGAVVVLYAVFAHYVSTVAGVGAWAILVAGVPILLAAAGMMRANWFGWVLMVAVVAALALLGWFWPTLNNPGAWFYFLQDIGINLALAMLFGRTLMAGRQPLITVIAASVQEEMSPPLLRYTRWVTWAWTLFFIVCALISIVLFFAVSIEAWSWFANILPLPLVGLMFIFEYGVRKCVLPKQDQSDLITTLRAACANFRQ
jgi:uncharacterized membrane protein